MGVETKTIGELIDELIVVNIKIWHLVDKGYAGDGEAAVKAQRFNERRGQLIRAINKQLTPDIMNVMEKVYG